MRILLLLLFFVSSLVSCIQPEALNAEADILSCSIPAEILKSEPEISNEQVTLYVKSDANVTKLAPTFTLTPGATISPASGTVQDFATPKQYIVTSEDKSWSKSYSVRCVVSGISTVYHFEQISLEPNLERYHIFYDLSPAGEPINWGSGNAGYTLTGVPKSPIDFPTAQSPKGYIGKGVNLITRSTGQLGEMVGMYIAAGNLFIGTFDVASALTNALKATRFGKTFEHVPTYLTGYYKYQPGKEFTIKGKPVSDRVDEFDIYAIFFETDQNVRYLDGTNSLTSPNLISIARITDRKITDEWTHFNIPFTALPGKVIDKEKLKKGGYQLSVIFSSSIRGAYFEGAVGSTLQVDEVEVVHTEIK